METKLCGRCKETKQILEFGKRSKTKDGLNYWCKACWNEYQRAYNQSNPEVRKQIDKKYYETHREQRLENYDKWLKNNPERRREINRQYRNNHLEKCRARDRSYYERVKKHRQDAEYKDRQRKYWQKHNATYPERVREKSRLWQKDHPEARRQWVKNNPEKFQAKQHRRRARVKGNGGSFTAQEWSNLQTFYGNRCLACGKSEPEIKLTPDHVIPIAKAGSNDISNIQPLCGSCNSRKHTQIIDYR